MIKMKKKGVINASLNSKKKQAKLLAYRPAWTCHLRPSMRGVLFLGAVRGVPYKGSGVQFVSFWMRDSTAFFSFSESFSKFSTSVLCRNESAFSVLLPAARYSTLTPSTCASRTATSAGGMEGRPPTYVKSVRGFMLAFDASSLWCMPLYSISSFRRSPKFMAL